MKTHPMHGWKKAAPRCQPVTVKPVKPLCVHKRTHTHTHTHTRTLTHTHTHTHTHTRTHTQPHTHTCSMICTHTPPGDAFGVSAQNVEHYMDQGDSWLSPPSEHE